MDFTLWLFVVALGCSALGGLLGMASGLFIVPALTVFGHMDVHAAVGASLVSVIACSCASAAPYLRTRLTHVRLAVVLESGTTLGALTGVLIAGVVPAQALDFLFAGILLVSAWQMFMKRVESKIVSTNGAGCTRTMGFSLDGSYPDLETGGEIRYTVSRVPLALSLMYVAGLVSALLGIGSGVLKIPAMDTALRLPIKVSTATSNFMIGVTAAASACAYFLRGEIVVPIAAPVALGSVVGAVVGARILMKVSSQGLRVFFVAVLLLVAAQMFLQGCGIRLF
ncbi:sulfite exporter TauE/SafE family protein [Paraburkholderia silvatlantica]|uniref:sulfite exporter TauE/SafE family protein n=1 Tax=Paraburkholderia silvatlantica TaxID=321895 RepID=UPI0037500458